MDRAEALPINFTISDKAREGIELVRDAYDLDSNDAAEVLLVGWARVMPTGAESYETVAVAFYRNSQRAEIAGLVQHAFGMEIAFTVRPEEHFRFAGKVLDFDGERGFFLRAPSSLARCSGVLRSG